MNKQLITVDPEIHSGTPVFAGTRVPIKTLFDPLEAGDALEVFLDDFPSVRIRISNSNRISMHSEASIAAIMLTNLGLLILILKSF